MQVKAFELERWQSVWENRVELNISESGVLPLTTEELVGDSGALGKIMNVRQGYPQTNGSEELRSRIAGLYAGADASRVLVTCGASEANFVTTWALLEPADEVVFMTPNYMQIAGLAAAFGATVKPLCLKEGRRWGIDPQDLKAAVTGKTRLIAICNPNNPTGAVLDGETREAITGAAAKAGAWILADEVYRGAEFDGGMTPSLWGSYERVICTGGLSKAYGLPGLRMGWIIGPGEFVERLWGYHDYTSIAPTVLTDRLACVALEPRRRNWILGRTRKMLKQNYAVLSNWLDSHGDRFSHIPPKAGAIAWIGLREGESSAQIARELLERKSVLVVPGEQFGMDSYLRIGFGGETEQLQQALSRFDEWLAERG